MYAQPQPESRDDYEAALTQGWPPTDTRELAALDRITDNAEADYAFSLGWCPFDRESASEFLASLGDVSFGERCGSQFSEEIPVEA